MSFRTGIPISIESKWVRIYGRALHIAFLEGFVLNFDVNIFWSEMTRMGGCLQKKTLKDKRDYPLI